MPLCRCRTIPRDTVQPIAMADQNAAGDINCDKNRTPGQVLSDSDRIEIPNYHSLNSTLESNLAIHADITRLPRMHTSVDSSPGHVDNSHTNSNSTFNFTVNSTGLLYERGGDEESWLSSDIQLIKLIVLVVVVSVLLLSTCKLVLKTFSRFAGGTGRREEVWSEAWYPQIAITHPVMCGKHPIICSECPHICVF